MNKAALYSTIAMLPVLAYAPLTRASAENTEPPTQPPSQMDKAPTQLEKPLEVGDIMPLFEIENADGGMISLDEMLQSGPVILTFYRGSWCPYCRTELSAIQDRLDQITKAGGSVLAVSPEIPEKTGELKKLQKLGFNIGTDHENTLAKTLALSFKLDAKTIKRYREYGIDVPESNDSKKWELPIPATYVIDTDRTIKFAYVDTDYTKRADYDKVIKVLQELQED